MDNFCKYTVQIHQYSYRDTFNVFYGCFSSTAKFKWTISVSKYKMNTISSSSTMVLLTGCQDVLSLSAMDIWAEISFIKEYDNSFIMKNLLESTTLKSEYSVYFKNRKHFLIQLELYYLALMHMSWHFYQLSYIWWLKKKLFRF